MNDNEYENKPVETEEQYEPELFSSQDAGANQNSSAENAFVPVSEEVLNSEPVNSFPENQLEILKKCAMLRLMQFCSAALPGKTMDELRGKEQHDENKNLDCCKRSFPDRPAECFLCNGFLSGQRFIS